MIRFDPKPLPWDDHSDDIFKHALDSIARDVQFHIKSMLDTGIDPNKSQLSRNIVVRNEEGQLIITEESKQSPEANLFTPSTQPPSIVDNSLIFRQVKEEEVIRRQQTAVKSSVWNAMTFKFKEYLEEGSKKVRSEKMGGL